MKLSELLKVLDEDEDIEIIYRIRKNVKIVKEENLGNMNILDSTVKCIRLGGCAMLFVEVG